MKKFFLAIYLLLIFSTTTANAYTVFVATDDTIDLTSVVGFYFDVSDVTSDQLDLTIYYQGDTVEVGGVTRAGAVPPNFNPGFQLPWQIDLITSPNGCAGKEVWPWGYNLSSGIILSLELEGDTAFSLDNFILTWSGETFNIIETSLEGGKEYTFSAVPIPGSLVLLGSGLIGLIGLGRRRMRQ
jgi:hypothetical protein